MKQFTMTYTGSIEPKARPRVTKTGHAYMPKKYAEWKSGLATIVGSRFRAEGNRPLEGPLKLEVDITKGVWGFRLTELESKERFGRADLDNLVGGVMDMLQDAGVIKNDSQIEAIAATFSPLLDAGAD